MCGIIGYVGNKNTLHVLIDGLKSLEYRGYDSAGIAYLKNKVKIIKEIGKVSNLEDSLNINDKTNIGIGHTRWATHGIPNKINSHPHSVGKITLVHNGIIENYQEIKKDLETKNYKFKSDTDTEVGCALLDYLYKNNNDMNKAIVEFQKIIKGSYALAIMTEDDKEVLYTIKNQSPLLIGIGDDENFVASDISAIIKYTNKAITLEDREFAKITATNIECYNEFGNIERKEIKTFDNSYNVNDKNDFEHFMLKEINEQPLVVKHTILPYLENGIESLIEKMPDLRKYNKIHIVACGSAMHAGLIGKNLIEEFGNIEVEVDIASEFRYKKLFLNKKSLIIVISQSGETADTLAALKIAKEKKIDTLGIINVPNSTIARETKMILYTKAGNEVAVATTKAYSTQLAMLSLIALNIGAHSFTHMKELTKDIKKLPILMEELLSKDYKKIAKKLYEHKDIFFIGRGIDYSISMEGSLKLKEISYIHSEAYPAGELKHGTISLIEKGTPVIAILTEEKLKEKTISNIKEVIARGAKVITISNETIDIGSYNITIAKIHKLFQSLLTIIPLQLIAYEVAKLKNCEIDKPKNLAKSVTVE